MKVPFFKVCQQRRALLTGSCRAPDRAAFASLLLVLRYTGKPGGRQILTRPWLLVGHRRIQRPHQRGTLPDKPSTSVAMAMAAALVPFGPLAPAL